MGGVGWGLLKNHPPWTQSYLYVCGERIELSPSDPPFPNFGWPTFQQMLVSLNNPN